MKKMLRRLFVFSMGFALATVPLSMVGAADYANEWDEAVTASSQMDADMQRQMMNNQPVPSSINLSSLDMDIETVLMLVQTERTRLLDAQLKEQLEQVGEKNKQTFKLNEDYNLLSGYLKQIRDGETRGESITISFYDIELVSGLDKYELFRLQDDVSQKQLNKVDLEIAIQQLRLEMGLQSSSQQMEMLRLQALSNKRNEAFDIMTDFIKKMQGNRESIISNMR